MKFYDVWGGPETSPHYAVGWAWAMDTPFKWNKQVASHFGGTRNPMVVSWPAKIKDKGGLRTQFHHVNDIAPTILEIVGIQQPKRFNGIEQKPMEGISFAYALADDAAKAPDQKQTQYFEMMGNRGIYHDGWMASKFHKVPWDTGASVPFSNDGWELYNINEDYSQHNDLAATNPARFGMDTFDIGMDLNAPVVRGGIYKTPFKFTGTIDNVKIELEAAKTAKK